MALDADTGKMVWEYKFNLFQSDVPPHRIGWASPAADPETGNIYALSGGAQVIALEPRRQAAVGPIVRRGVRRLHDARRPDDVAARRRRPGDRQRRRLELGHGSATARTASSRSTSGPATSCTSRTRADGPYDTAYAAPLIATINGMRLLIAGLGDGGDSRHQAADGREGLELRRREARHQHRRGRQGQHRCSSRTATRTSTGNELGHDRGDRRLADRRHQDDEVGGQGDRVRLFVAGDRRQRVCIRSTTARRCRRSTSRPASELWTQPLGTAQKAPPVLADGKIYVGTDGGKFFIVRPRADRAEILSAVELPNSTNSCCGSEGTPEQILAGAAISRGRIFFVSSDAVYAIGSRQATAPTGFAVDEPRGAGAGRAGATCRSSPTELVLTPGQTVQAARAAVRRQGPLPPRGDRGHVVARRARRARWRTARSRSCSDPVEQAGLIKATRRRPHRPGARARRRVRCPGRRRSTRTPTAPRRRMGQRRRRQVCRVPRSTGRRCCRRRRSTRSSSASASFIGPTNWSNYTFEADVRAADAAPADGRRRHHRAALFAGAVRHLAAAEDRAVGAGDRAHRHRAVRVEARHLVSAEAARREPAERAGARAGQGVGGRRARAGRVDDRQDRSDRQPRRARPGCSSTRSSARIWTTSRSRRINSEPMSPAAVMRLVAIYAHAIRDRCDPRIVVAALASTIAIAPASAVAPPIPAPATGRCGAARPTATWCRT